MRHLTGLYNGIAGMASEDARLLSMSTLTEEGVMEVRQVACDRLLATRVEQKLQVCLQSSVLLSRLP